jgi:hypothetical protein
MRSCRNGGRGAAERHRVGAGCWPPARRPNVDLDEADDQDGLELPGADLSGEELVMPVIPKRADEFTCGSCFLVQHRSWAARTAGGRAICFDCG